MKKILLAVLTVCSLISCKEEKKPVKKKDYLVLSGKIEKYKKRSFTLKGFNYERKIKFDRKTKTFSDTIKGLKPGPYKLRLDKKTSVRVYLADTVDLKVNADYKKRTKLPVFNGDNSSISVYLNKKYNKKKMILRSPYKFFGLLEKDYLKKNEEFKSEILALLKKSKLPVNFSKLEKQSIENEFYRNINSYQRLHRLVKSDEKFKVSENYPNIITKVNFNNYELYTFSKQYREFIKEYIDAKSEKSLKKGADESLNYLKTVHTEITNKSIKNDLIHKYSLEALTYTGNLKEFYKKYMSYSTDEKNKKEIQVLYNKLKLIATGMPSPKFKNYEDINGKKVSLDDLLGKGKYIYIDIWATWCSFCKKEVPLLKNLEVKYHGKNIEFVSICVDKKSSKGKWKKIVKEKEMGGVQLFPGNTHKNLMFTKKYLIKGLPRFILLAPDGKIVSSNAPRPSEGEELQNIFKELGIKQ